MTYGQVFYYINYWYFKGSKMGALPVISIIITIVLLFLAIRATGKLLSFLQFVFAIPTYLRKNEGNKIVGFFLGILYCLALLFAAAVFSQGELPEVLHVWLHLLLWPNAASLVYELVKTTKEGMAENKTAAIAARNDSVAPEELVEIDTFNSMLEKIQGIKSIAGAQAWRLEARVNELLEAEIITKKEAIALYDAIDNGVNNSLHPK